MGYFDTTGLEAIDYLIADRHLVPVGDEQIVRLPDSWVCYAPPGLGPTVGPCQAISRGHVTFGSFKNNPAKHNVEVRCHLGSDPERHPQRAPGPLVHGSVGLWTKRSWANSGRCSMRTASRMSECSSSHASFPW